MKSCKIGPPEEVVYKIEWGGSYSQREIKENKRNSPKLKGYRHPVHFWQADFQNKNSRELTFVEYVNVENTKLT